MAVVSVCETCHDFDPTDFNPSQFTLIEALPFGAISAGVSTYLPGLVCLRCNECVAIAEDVSVGPEDDLQWRTLDLVLTNNDGGGRNGWYEMTGNSDDWFRHSILNRIVYGINNSPNRASLECYYADPDPKLDTLFLLWQQDKAVGFCTLRSDFGDKRYQQHTPQVLYVIDTVFVQKEYRGQGHTTNLIQGIMHSQYGPDLGLSDPVSDAMLHVALRLLGSEKRYREKIWLLRDVGGRHRERACLWWNAPRMMQQRGLSLAAVLKKTKAKSDCEVAKDKEDYRHSHIFRLLS